MKDVVEGTASQGMAAAQHAIIEHSTHLPTGLPRSPPPCGRVPHRVRVLAVALQAPHLRRRTSVVSSTVALRQVREWYPSPVCRSLSNERLNIGASTTYDRCIGLVIRMTKLREKFDTR